MRSNLNSVRQNQKHNLAEEEEIVVFDDGDLQSELDKCTKSLMGRLMADCPFSSETMEAAMFAIWGQPAGFKVQNHGGLPNYCKTRELGRKVERALGEVLDKEGGREKSESSIQKFQNFINEVGLIDLGYEGPKFTWTNRKYGINHIKEMLNTAFASEAWKNSYPRALVSHLSNVGSDHRPILLTLETHTTKPKRQFRF
ncbi:hypothetical protein Ahy_B05g075354 [Arachis hypogaea]|uniref:Endonuclease/exonuclease/phosphatase domain-containing protein n=1 Tax=Arachis hypogaea TaxID=3818 RepID=A0A444Z106_ARAHY|nr:hypothetical protein Ahy_B05g075354 [Arachis hypogaea]